MITARSSVLNIKPGYYPKLSMVLRKLVRPVYNKSGRNGWGRSARSGGKRPPLLMTPKAIRNRAWKAAYRQRKQSVTSRGTFSLERVLFDAAIDDPDDQHEYWNSDQP